MKRRGREPPGSIPITAREKRNKKYRNKLLRRNRGARVPGSWQLLAPPPVLRPDPELLWCGREFLPASGEGRVSIGPLPARDVMETGGFPAPRCAVGA